MILKHKSESHQSVPPLYPIPFWQSFNLIVSDTTRLVLVCDCLVYDVEGPEPYKSQK